MRKIFSVLIYQLYLLQLENYEIARYLQLLNKKGFYGSKQSLRKELVWTTKTKIIFSLSLFFVVLLAVSLYQINFYLAFGGLILGFSSMPFFYVLALIVSLPMDMISKKRAISEAEKIIKNSKNLKIIGIAGSYGKTTMKNILDTVLAEKYKVLTTPESVNTPLGIAEWLIRNYSDDVDILIVEMGEHYRGDVDYLCGIFPPDIAIVTGINEAHIERMGNLENIVATIFEIVEGVKDTSLIVLNADDDNVKKNHQKYTKGKDIAFYSYLNNPLVDLKIKNSHFETDKLCWSVDIDKLGTVEIPLLGEYAIGDVVAATIVAKNLSLSDQEIKKGISKIVPTVHRLQPINGKGGVLVIDDSYNGNVDGVTEAIKVLDRFKDKRRIYITPGLVETGATLEAVHVEIGKNLAEVADKVILIKNSATPYIANGLKQNNFKYSDIIWFNTAEEAHGSLGKILKPNDVILFQNDWGDQYL